MKCEICNRKIEKIFLEKINGTYIKDSKGKLHVVCSDCQRKLSKEDMLKVIENK
jgi:hypothetical protein